MKLFLVAVGPPSLNLSLFLIHPSGWEDQRASDKRWRGSGDRGDGSSTEDSRRSREHCSCHWLWQKGSFGQGRMCTSCYISKLVDHHAFSARHRGKNKVFTCGRADWASLIKKKVLPLYVFFLEIFTQINAVKIAQ